MGYWGSPKVDRADETAKGGYSYILGIGRLALLRMPFCQIIAPHKASMVMAPWLLYTEHHACVITV
jgi:hypothetical protein